MPSSNKFTFSIVGIKGGIYKRGVQSRHRWFIEREGQYWLDRIKGGGDAYQKPAGEKLSLVIEEVGA